MRILITAKEAAENGVWSIVADAAGYDIYAMAEGMDPDTEICLTVEQAVSIGLIALP